MTVIPLYWQKRLDACAALSYDKRVERVWQELGALLTTEEKVRAIAVLREMLNSGKLLESQQK